MFETPDLRGRRSSRPPGTNPNRHPAAGDREEKVVMNHHDLRLAAWPCLAVVACLLLVAGCEEGSGPSLVTTPDGKPAFEGAKPPPPPPPPPADPAIAFEITGRVRAGHGWRTAWFLKVMNADGTNVTPIFMTEPGQSIGFSRPAWSPDGRCIAFYRDGVAPNPGIYLVDVSLVNGVPTGTNVRLFLSDPAWMPAWSPLGDQIAYVTGDDSGSLCVIPVSGGAAQVLYSSPSMISSLSWSPDARKIAFEDWGAGYPHTIRVLDLNDMTVTTVGIGPELDPAYPSWARTQDAVVFEGVIPSGERGIYTMQLPSGTPVSACAGTQPDWSPTDQALVFRVGNTLNKIELTTGITTRLMSSGSEASPTMPAWRRF
jgi:hypothetical protein